MLAENKAMTSDAWHAVLRETDAAARASEDQWMRLHAVEVLEERLAQSQAQVHALREAVAFRDQIIGEFHHAVAERDALLERRAEVVPAPPRAPLWRRGLRYVRRRAGTLRRRLSA